MKAIRFALGSFLFLAFFTSPSMAQVQRTFVSGLGNDMNPCTRTAPCRTFTQAISQTTAGGEVIVLDSAGYGPAAITQAVTISAPPGVYAGISVFSGNGITISAGPSDVVILRGLTINNQGSTGDAIVFTSGDTLHIESCVVKGFTSGFSDGAVFFSGPGKLEVIDSIIRDNNVAIAVKPASGTATATIDQTRFERNFDGVIAWRGSKVTVRNSVASSNGGLGFQAFTDNTDPAEMNIENCAVSNNTKGIAATSNSTGIATVRVSNSTVTDNSTNGLENTGSPAVLLSRGNNTVEGNGTDTVGTIGSYTAK